MAQNADDGQKTEDPSQRKLDRARDEGQVAQSREINTWFMLGTAGLILLFLAPSTARAVSHALAAFVEPGRFIAADGIMWGAVASTLRGVAISVALPLGLLMLAAVVATVAQTGFVFATEKLRFDLGHISPASGAKRLFSLRSLVEMLKSLAKVAVVGAVAVMMLRGEVDRIAGLATLSPEDALGIIEHLMLRLLVGVLSVLTLLAGMDYVYQRLQHIRSLRMTKREVKDEQKQSEGDPLIRGRLRQIRMDRARRRMMAAVPGASVVITNPTHYAVALKYELGAAGAPKVVAKGSDLIALRIREIAAENDVPVVENPPLARALHASVEIDREIPPEHYKAVAEIIGYVFRLKGKIGPRAAAV
ncbi:MAG TPA: flagellar biosynthesis protein FlhB [Stellaceae bacterium]|nr:flagellar biosynthesis protein FlhB [Stellaceae bacterium]